MVRVVKPSSFSPAAKQFLPAGLWLSDCFPYYRLISAAACVQVCGDKRSWKSTQEWCWKLTTADKTVTLIMQMLPDVTQQHGLQKALIKHNSWTITFRAHQRCWYTFQKLWLSSAPKQFEGQITNTFSRPNLHKYQVGTRNVFPLGHVSFSFVRWCYLLKPKNTKCSLFECIFFYTWFLSWCPIHYNRRLVWTTEVCWSQMCLGSMNSVLVPDLIDVFLFLETVSRRYFARVLDIIYIIYNIIIIIYIFLNKTLLSVTWQQIWMNQSGVSPHSAKWNNWNMRGETWALHLRNSVKHGLTFDQRPLS